jgi:hypothetical protein
MSHEDNPADETYYEDHPDNPASKVESLDRFAYSFNGENYTGGHTTREDAIAEAKAEADDHTRFYTGRCVPPQQPEDFWNAEDWLDHVSCQDEYGSDWADGWDDSTAAQRAELETEVRAVMAAWLDRHKLRPGFFTIDDEQEHEIEEPTA